MQTNSIPVMARSYFQRALGVDWETPVGKSVFYNDRLSKLFVMATESDLDKIERGILELKPPMPQIHIKARFSGSAERVFW